MNIGFSFIEALKKYPLNNMDTFLYESTIYKSKMYRKSHHK
jgi:hypothetical protein